MSRSITLDNLGRALLDQGHAAEAEESFRRALALAEEGGDEKLTDLIQADREKIRAF